MIRERLEMKLIEQHVPKDDPDGKAIACYGLYVPALNQMQVRFVQGRPLSGSTCASACSCTCACACAVVETTDGITQLKPQMDTDEHSVAVPELNGLNKLK